MKKESKIRSPFVKNVMEDREKMENIIRETTKSSLHGILEEAVKNELNNLINEADESDYEEQEVDDTVATTDDNSNDSIDTSTETDFNAGAEGDDTEGMEGGEGEFGFDDAEGVDDNGEDEWGQFDDYKGEDGTYDFTNADSETFIKVYKLMKDDDMVAIQKDSNGNTHIKDNETGSEYMIVSDEGEDMESGEGIGGMEDLEGMEDTEDMGSTEEAFTTDDSESENYGMEDIESQETDDDMDEATVFEIAFDDDEENVNEENLGYTTDYQKKTAMTTPSNAEPAKASQTYSMDKGVPTGTEKPWVGNAGNMKPFDEEDETKEDDETITEEDEIEEGTNVGGFVQQNSTSKSHVPNSSGRSARNASIAGKHVKSTSQPRYSAGGVSEDIKRKANAIWEENKQLKKELVSIKESLKEAVVLNYNLGQITKLFTENTTSREEKINIIKRFGNEAKSVTESKKLYESVSKDLKKVSQLNGVNNIDKQLSESKNSNILVETPIYQSDDLTESLNLMKRLINL